MQMPQQTRITLVVHTRPRPMVGPLSKLAPTASTRDGNDPISVGFLDMDGEVHVFPLGDEGKDDLIRQLTGGVEVAKPSRILTPPSAQTH